MANNMTAVADCMYDMQPKMHFPKSHFDTNGNILLHSFTIKHEVLKEGDAGAITRVCLYMMT